MDYLNPESAPMATAVWQPVDPVPRNVREWGYCPNFPAWLPGDLILVSALQPGFVQKAIRTVQSQGYAMDHARWEHAAVYIGSGALCEATRKGVSVGMIYPYVGKHLLRVRRNQALTPDQRWVLAVNALKLQDHSYGFRAIVELLWSARSIGFRAHGVTVYGTRARICSELYADAHAKASGGVVVGNLNSGITPASLSIETKLTDIALEWVRIV